MGSLSDKTRAKNSHAWAPLISLVKSLHYSFIQSHFSLFTIEHIVLQEGDPELRLSPLAQQMPGQRNPTRRGRGVMSSLTKLNKICN
jgi:hypothetical protein